MAELKKVCIYTDGACINNPGPGGYGAVLLSAGHRKELSGGVRLTTNNRMEIMAAIVGLQALKFACTVTVYTDSRYLADSMMRGWAQRWRSDGWTRKKRHKIPNHDLWAKLLDLCAGHSVTFAWVRGHASDPENEHCDRLAIAATQGSRLPPDEGYEHPQDPLPNEPLFEAVAFPEGSEGAERTCGLCGGPIPGERLDAIPSTVLCVACQRAEERALQVNSA